MTHDKPLTAEELAELEKVMNTFSETKAFSLPRQKIQGLITAIRTLTARLAAAEQRADKADGELASACDLTNSWCRESHVRECKNPYTGFQLREAIDGLWSRLSGRLHELTAERDKWKQRAEAWERAVEDIAQEPKRLPESAISQTFSYGYMLEKIAKEIKRRHAELLAAPLPRESGGEG